jgi:hypothetical protein
LQDLQLQTLAPALMDHFFFKRKPKNKNKKKKTEAAVLISL